MNQDALRVFMPIDFFTMFFHSPLCIFNGELEKGGAFRLRAVGAVGDGRPERSSEYIFFKHGFFSLAMQSEEMKVLWREKSGFEVEMKKKVQKDGKHYYWEIGSNHCMYFRGESHNLLTLRASVEKPTGKGVIVLFGVDGNPGQYFYLN